MAIEIDVNVHNFANGIYSTDQLIDDVRSFLEDERGQSEVTVQEILSAVSKEGVKFNISSRGDISFDLDDAVKINKDVFEFVDFDLINLGIKDISDRISARDIEFHVVDLDGKLVTPKGNNFYKVNVQNRIDELRENGLKLGDSDFQHLRNNATAVLIAVKQNGMALQYASDELKKSRAVILAALKQNGLAYQHLGNEEKKQAEFIYWAMRQNSHALDDVMTTLESLDDKEATTKFLDIAHFYGYRGFVIIQDSDSLKQIIKETVIDFPMMMGFLTQDMLTNKKTFAEVANAIYNTSLSEENLNSWDWGDVLDKLEETPQLLSLIPKETAEFAFDGLITYRDFVEAAIFQDKTIDGTTVKVVNERAISLVGWDWFTNDVALLKLILKGSEDPGEDPQFEGDGKLIRHLNLADFSPGDRNDLILAALENSGYALRFLTEEDRGNASYVTKAVEQNGMAIRFAAVNPQSDQDLTAYIAMATTAVEQNGYAVQYVQRINYSGKQSSYESLFEKAVGNNGLALKYISEQSTAIIDKALAQTPLAAAHISGVKISDTPANSNDNKTFQQCYFDLDHLPPAIQTAIASDGNVLAQMKSQVTECFLAYLDDPDANPIPAEFLSAAMAGIQENTEALRYIPNSIMKDWPSLQNLIDQEPKAYMLATKFYPNDAILAMKAVKKDPSIIEKVDDQLRTTPLFVSMVTDINLNDYKINIANKDLKKMFGDTAAGAELLEVFYTHSAAVFRVDDREPKSIGTLNLTAAKALIEDIIAGNVPDLNQEHYLILNQVSRALFNRIPRSTLYDKMLKKDPKNWQFLPMTVISSISFIQYIEKNPEILNSLTDDVKSLPHVDFYCRLKAGEFDFSESEDRGQLLKFLRIMPSLYQVLPRDAQADSEVVNTILALNLGYIVNVPPEAWKDDALVRAIARNEFGIGRLAYEDVAVKLNIGDRFSWEMMDFLTRENFISRDGAYLDTYIEEPDEAGRLIDAFVASWVEKIDQGLEGLLFIQKDYVVDYVHKEFNSDETLTSEELLTKEQTGFIFDFMQNEGWITSELSINKNSLPSKNTFRNELCFRFGLADKLIDNMYNWLSHTDNIWTDRFMSIDDNNWPPELAESVIGFLIAEEHVNSDGKFQGSIFEDDFMKELNAGGFESFYARSAQTLISKLDHGKFYTYDEFKAQTGFSDQFAEVLFGMSEILPFFGLSETGLPSTVKLDISSLLNVTRGLDDGTVYTATDLGMAFESMGVNSSVCDALVRMGKREGSLTEDESGVWNFRADQKACEMLAEILFKAYLEVGLKEIYDSTANSFANEIKNQIEVKSTTVEEIAAYLNLGANEARAIFDRLGPGFPTSTQAVNGFIEDSYLQSISNYYEDIIRASISEHNGVFTGSEEDYKAFLLNAVSHNAQILQMVKLDDIKAQGYSRQEYIAIVKAGLIHCENPSADVPKYYINMNLIDSESDRYIDESLYEDSAFMEEIVGIDPDALVFYEGAKDSDFGWILNAFKKRPDFINNAAIDRSFIYKADGSVRVEKMKNWIDHHGAEALLMLTDEDLIANIDLCKYAMKQTEKKLYKSYGNESFPLVRNQLENILSLLPVEIKNDIDFQVSVMEYHLDITREDVRNFNQILTSLNSKRAFPQYQLMVDDENWRTSISDINTLFLLIATQRPMAAFLVPDSVWIKDNGAFAAKTVSFLQEMDNDPAFDQDPTDWAPFLFSAMDFDLMSDAEFLSQVSFYSGGEGDISSIFEYAALAMRYDVNFMTQQVKANGMHLQYVDTEIEFGDQPDEWIPINSQDYHNIARIAVTQNGLAFQFLPTEGDPPMVSETEITAERILELAALALASSAGDPYTLGEDEMLVTNRLSLAIRTNRGAILAMLNNPPSIPSLEPLPRPERPVPLNEILKLADPSLLNDQSFIRAVAAVYPEGFMQASDTIKSNKVFMLDLIQNVTSEVFKYSGDFKADYNVCRAAIAKDATLFSHVDIRGVLDADADNGFEHIENLLNLAVTTEPEQFSHITSAHSSGLINQDEYFNLASLAKANNRKVEIPAEVEDSPAYVLKLAARIIKNFEPFNIGNMTKTEVYNKIIDDYPMFIAWADERFLGDASNIANLVKANLDIYQNLPEELQKNHDIALAAVRKDLKMLNSLPVDLKTDKKFVLEALDIPGVLTGTTFWNFIDADLKADADVMYKILQKDVSYSDLIPHSLNTNESFVINALNVSNILSTNGTLSNNAFWKFMHSSVKQKSAVMMKVLQKDFTFRSLIPPELKTIKFFKDTQDDSQAKSIWVDGTFYQTLSSVPDIQKDIDIALNALKLADSEARRENVYGHIPDDLKNDIAFQASVFADYPELYELHTKKDDNSFAAAMYVSVPGVLPYISAEVVKSENFLSKVITLSLALDSDYTFPDHKFADFNADVLGSLNGWKIDGFSGIVLFLATVTLLRTEGIILDDGVNTDGPKFNDYTVPMSDAKTTEVIEAFKAQVRETGDPVTPTERAFTDTQINSLVDYINNDVTTSFNDFAAKLAYVRAEGPANVRDILDDILD